MRANMKNLFQLISLIILFLSVSKLNAQSNVTEALLDYQKGKYIRASIKFEEIIKSNPDQVEAYKYLANCYLKTGDYKSAKKVLNNSHEKFPKDLDIKKSYSALLLNLKEIENAFPLVMEIVETSPNDIDWSLNLAAIYLSKNQSDKAMTVYDRLLDNFPEEKKIYDHFSEYLTRTRQYEQVRNLYANLLKHKSGDKEIKKIIAETYIDEQNIEEAAIQYEILYKSYPDDLEILLTLADLYTQYEKQKKAIELLKNSTQTEVDLVVLNLGKLYTDLDKVKEATELYKDYLKSDPDNVEILSCLGKIYFAQKELKLSLATYKNALSVKKKDPLLLSSAADVHAASDQKDSALYYYTKAFEENITALQKEQVALINNVNSINVFESLGSSQLVNSKLNQYKINIEKSNDYLFLYSDSSDYITRMNQLIIRYKQAPLLYYYRSLFYNKHGQKKKALLELEKVLTLSPKIEEAHLVSAEIHESMGNSSQAILCYKRILSLDANNDNAYNSLIRLYRNDNNLNQLCDEWLKIYPGQKENLVLKSYLIESLHKANRKEEASIIINNRKN